MGAQRPTFIFSCLLFSISQHLLGPEELFFMFMLPFPIWKLSLWFKWSRNRNPVISLVVLLACLCCHLFTYIFYLGSVILPWKIQGCCSFISSCSLPACFLCCSIVFVSCFSFFSPLQDHGELMILWKLPSPFTDVFFLNSSLLKSHCGLL